MEGKHQGYKGQRMQYICRHTKNMFQPGHDYAQHTSGKQSAYDVCQNEVTMSAIHSICLLKKQECILDRLQAYMVLSA